MENLKDKKTSFLIILLSVLFLIYGIFAKYDNIPDNYYFGENEVPLKYFDVDIFGISFDFLNFFLFLLISFGIGVYLLIYKNDQSLKKLFKKPKFFTKTKSQNSDDKFKIKKINFLDNLKSKYSEFENKNLSNKEVEKTELPKEDRATSIVKMVTIVAIIFTFYMATKVGFSLWFFIIYAYYHYLTLAPKSKKEITIKSIGYPLIFLILFSIFEKGNGETIMGMEFERPLSYYLSKHFIPFIIGVIIMFFSLRKQLGNKPKFSIKNPLFWISLICFLISIFRFGVIKYMENS